MDVANISITLAISRIRKIYRSRLRFYVGLPIEFVSRLRVVSCGLTDDLQIWHFACLWSIQAHHLAAAEQNHAITVWPSLENPYRHRRSTPGATIGSLCDPIVRLSMTGEVDRRPDKHTFRTVAVFCRFSMCTHRRKGIWRQRTQCLVFTSEHRLEVFRMQRPNERAESNRSHNNPLKYLFLHSVTDFFVLIQGRGKVRACRSVPGRFLPVALA